MNESEQASQRPPIVVGQALDLAGYLIVQAIVWIAIAAAVSIALGVDLEMFTLALFFAGMGLFLIGAIKMRPETYVERRRREIARKRGKDEDSVRGWMPISVGGGSDGDDDLGTILEQLLAATPPISWMDLDPDERVSIGLKLFLSGGVLWIVAYLVEQYVVF